MTFFRKSGSLGAVWIKLLATAAQCSFCSGSRSRGMNITTTCFMARLCIKILDTVVFGIPRAASSSHTVCQSSVSVIAAHTYSTFSGVLLVAGLPECRSLSTDSQPSLKCLCHTLICAALIALSLKAFWITWIVFMEECSSLMQNLMQIGCSTHSVILYVTTTQYTCWLNGVYRPHWLVQRSRHYSLMHIPVHSPWLSGYIDVTQTALIILAMAGLFPDRPHMSSMSPVSAIIPATPRKVIYQGANRGYLWTVGSFLPYNFSVFTAFWA